MGKVKMFYQRTCPHCIAAMQHLGVLIEENPAYRSVQIEKIDEVAHPLIAKKYDYYYVPTFFLGDVKLHEGSAGFDNVKAVLDAALES